MRAEHAIFLGALLLVVAVAMVVGALIDRAVFRDQVRAVPETLAYEAVLDDGSRILHRDPQAKPDSPAPERPAGHTPVRVVEVEVLPPPVEITCSDGKVVEKACPPVTVRLDLLRAPDGTLRAQASSPGGEVLGGLDVPLEPALVPVQRRWAVGYERDLDGNQGVFLERDLGRLRVGGSVVGDAVSARVGWRF